MLKNMAALLGSTGYGRLLRTIITSGSLCSSSGGRSLHVTAVCCKSSAGRFRRGKGQTPVSYEQAHAPHYIGHRKGWLSQNTSNLKGEKDAADRTIEDMFMRRFINGTFQSCLADEIIIKRRGNMIILCVIMLQKLLPMKMYFLIGYTETILSHLYKCPVKLEIQTIEAKVIYKWF
ncbi:small ribosomal subunit protein uS3m [Antennarius striatus]|uniref:small ribosomal subunit protein uS3m n=1 Tax=Antennarius striatus TaxID=241820 RepID=UPI0035AE5415